MLQDRIPNSFRLAETAIEDLNWLEDLIPDSGIAKRRDVHVEGIGLTLSEYWIRPNQDMLFDEGMLLDAYFGHSIFAITFESLNGKANRITRAFVINRGSR